MVQIVTDGSEQEARRGKTKAKLPGWAKVLETEIEDSLDWIYASVAKSYSIDYHRLNEHYTVLEVVKLWAIDAHNNSVTYGSV